MVPGLVVLGISLRGARKIAARLCQVVLLEGPDTAIEIDPDDFLGVVDSSPRRPLEIEIMLPAPDRIRQHVESLGDVLELALGPFLVRALEAIGMPLARQLAKTHLDLARLDVARQVENAVEVFDQTESIPLALFYRLSRYPAHLLAM